VLAACQLRYCASARTYRCRVGRWARWRRGNVSLNISLTVGMHSDSPLGQHFLVDLAM
jgi:hypothetical protein